MDKFMNLKIKPYIMLARPANIALVTTVILITSAFYSPYPPVWKVLLSILCVAFITAAGNTLNDLNDIEIDRINKPKRPLPSGTVTPENAKRYMYLLFIFGNGFALILGFWNLLLSLLIVTPALYWYAKHLRNVPLAGNVMVAFLSSLTFIFAAAAFRDLGPAYIPALYCFMISLIREIVKDLEDLSGDGANNSNTLPVAVGEASTRVIAAIMILFFLPMIPLPYLAGLYNKWFFFIAVFAGGVPMVVMMVRLFQVRKAVNYYQLASVMKIIMFIGLLALFIGRV
ncbi:MAG: geranylgeranylglycerol-phosphate geranylgeranyltransferase [Candidatus Marinimicrobia bacterium]|nr:geranylgeranylglycerol-phosphate geranylgeranyltransferase [Candidatus Neomarinimicrobiota bacterium]